METDSFAQMIQTFGASPDRWETDRTDQIKAWTETKDGKRILRAEKDLDDCLNTVCPPVTFHLIDKIRTAVLNERMQRQILLFWRISPWVSFLCVIGGFYLGWHQNQLDYVNTQSYFSAMFEDLTY